MRFRSDRPIFQQIIEQIEARIVQGDLAADARVPAVREVALELEVNPNTVVRSFLELEQSGVIFKRRGLGYFVSADAKDQILDRQRKDFLEQELPEVVRKMRLLGLGPDVLQRLFNDPPAAARGSAKQ